MKKLNELAKDILEKNSYNPVLEGSLYALYYFCNPEDEIYKEEEVQRFIEDYPEFKDKKTIDEIVDHAIYLILASFWVVRKRTIFSNGDDSDFLYAKQIVYLPNTQGMVLENVKKDNISLYQTISFYMNGKTFSGKVIGKSTIERSVCDIAEVTQKKIIYTVKYHSINGYEVTNISQQEILKNE